MPKPTYLLYFIWGLLLMSCRQVDQSAYLTETISIAGVERTYHVYLPPNFDESQQAPLVLALHGGGGVGLGFDAGTAGTLLPAADYRGVVLVFPEGVDKQWCDGRFEHIDSDRDCTAVDDVAFISALIDKMVASYGIDSARVYVTGISNGGFMSVRLAMDLSEKITAVAPVTAQLSVALEAESPDLPVSIMVINGTADPLVPYEGGEVRVVSFGRSRGEVLSTAETVERFRGHNGCLDGSETVRLPDSVPEDGTTIEMVTYAACEAGSEVILVKVIGGGHAWPGGKQYLGEALIGTVSQEINASELILDFFLNHGRSAARNE